MGSSSANGEEVAEQAMSDRAFPITEIRTSGAPAPKPNTGFLRFLSYGLPWAAWIINVALLITTRYQKADISLCIGGEYLQQQLIESGVTNVTSLSSLCEFRIYHLGVVQSTEELASVSTLSVEDELNDLAGDDLYNNLALGASIVPVALGLILMCTCCGPVLLGEFTKGQSMLWNISTLVGFMSALFSGLAMLFLKTDICEQQQICTILQDNDRYATVASSILGFNGAITAVNNENDENTPIAVDCEQTCSVDAGLYLSVVATLLWLFAFVGTIMLKKANAKIHP